MINFVKKGDIVDIVTPSGGLTSGQFYMLGALAGVVAQTALEGAANQLHRTGQFSLPKATGEVWAVGNPLYWDENAAKFTTVVADNIPAGIAGAAALTGDTSGEVILTPSGSGLVVKSGQHTTVTAADTVVTGLSSVVAAIASLDSDPVAGAQHANASIGDQAGAPAAGSILINSWKATATADTAMIAATTFSKKVNWIAVGIAN